MQRHVILLLLCTAVLFMWGLSMTFASSQVVHQIGAMEQKNQELAERVTVYESQYHEQTQEVIAQKDVVSHYNMVAYSLRDERVRYAQVGGSVYSMLRPSDL